MLDSSTAPSAGASATTAGVRFSAIQAAFQHGRTVRASAAPTLDTADTVWQSNSVRITGPPEGHDITSNGGARFSPPFDPSTAAA